MFYAGIGSLKTPDNINILFDHIGYFLAKCGLTLRSGGADGADLAFEGGCNKAKGDRQIFLPWEGFNDSKSKRFFIKKEAYDMAAKYHPRWDTITNNGSKKLLARDMYQALGYDLVSPSDFIICWTEGGLEVGGTAMALRVAKDYNIKVFNFGSKENKNFIPEIKELLLSLNPDKFNNSAEFELCYLELLKNIENLSF